MVKVGARFFILFYVFIYLFVYLFICISVVLTEHTIKNLHMFYLNYKWKKMILQEYNISYDKINFYGSSKIQKLQLFI